MSELFGIDIQGLVTDSLEGQLHTVTIIREGELADGVEYDPIDDRYEDENGDPVAEPTDQVFTTEGIEEDYKKFYEAGLVSASEVPILMLAKPLGTTPKKGDRISIDGENYTMTGIIDKDPAKATWTVKAET